MTARREAHVARRFVWAVPQQPAPEPDVTAPDFAQPGELITIEVTTGASRVLVKVPGREAFYLAVPPSGRVEWRVPTDVEDEALISICDMQFPNPSTAIVEVLSTD